MSKRLVTLSVVTFGVWAIPALAAAQETPDLRPNLNWVFLLAIVTLLGFLAFIGFVAMYYVLAVVARNRKFATQAAPVAGTAPAGPVAASPPAAPVIPAGPAPVAAAAPAAAAPAAAPAQAPAAAPAEPAAAAAPAAAPAATPAAAPVATGGIPKIDATKLPDGIDAVTRGRLKKLAVLQERGQEPPPELLEDLKGVLEQMGGAPAAAPAPAPAAAPEAPAAEAAPAEGPAAEAAPAAEPAAEPAPAAEVAPPAEPAAAAAPAADTGDLPRIDPNNLPDGIDAVARGRLKKLAVLQERGEQPPADLVEKLKPLLDQIKG